MYSISILLTFFGLLIRASTCGNNQWECGELCRPKVTLVTSIIKLHDFSVDVPESAVDEFSTIAEFKKYRKAEGKTDKTTGRYIVLYSTQDKSVFDRFEVSVLEILIEKIITTSTNLDHHVKELDSFDPLRHLRIKYFSDRPELREKYREYMKYIFPIDIRLEHQ